MADRTYTAVFVQRMEADDLTTIAALAFWERDACVLPVPGFEQAALLWHHRLLVARQHGVTPQEFYEEWDGHNGVTYGFGPPERVRARSAADACRKVLAQHPNFGGTVNWDSAQEFGPQP